MVTSHIELLQYSVISQIQRNPPKLFVTADAHAQEHLQTVILGYGAEVIFHVMGFSAQHNEQFLESLSFLGTSDGSYSYVSPNVSNLKQTKKIFFWKTRMLIKKYSFYFA